MKKAFRNIVVLLFLILYCSSTSIALGKKQDTVQDSTAVKKYPYVLPIWGQKVADRNIDLQLPFGFNVSYVYNQMTLDLTHFSMNFYDGLSVQTPVTP
ncbi:hypothetical protein JIV24_06740 [Carboxylicivirga sp. N1Y132]|uniref:Uncharacterized protein n=1 Tax=Carboxylicivirga marina TaxID=2800988 RepID=A0ABS1HHC2_9BACT|nr:hypothetical protein [Carboxylicivirga marina]